MLRSNYPTNLHDHLGNEVRLPNKPFATGGEGAVFDVVNRPDLVAKLYNRPQSRDRCDKLQAMAKLCNSDLLKFAAWPTATLHSSNSGAVDGILMPRISDYEEIHYLYSVAQRKKAFPKADWGFLLHTARNCAIAFESIHNQGHVVGDVNQKNVLVSQKGIVALVDCDSFQVKVGSRIFRCGVGVPEYTPPELHGKKFSNLDRDTSHDQFGMAVLLFHLLMMGRHPFAGVPQVNTDIPIEKAIQDGLYAYGRNTSKLKPPPHVPPMTMLDAPIRELFERAFGSQQRPTATEWRDALDESMKGLQRCKNDRMHSYAAAAGYCPWCKFIATDRLMFFIPSRDSGIGIRIEDIRRLLQKLAGMQLVFQQYNRPRPLLPIQVKLPANLRQFPMPRLEALAHQPAMLPPPVLRLQPSPPVIPVAPKLRPHPLRPLDLPSPNLHPKPAHPVYPPIPAPVARDPFWARFCVAFFLVGWLVYYIAWPVGMTVMVGFGVSWLVFKLTEGMRRDIAQKALEEEYREECSHIEAHYLEQVRPIDRANQKLLDAWKAANEARLAEHAFICKQIDDENGMRLAPWQATKAAIEAEHLRRTQDVTQANQHAMSSWEAENAKRQAIYIQSCREIEARNQLLISSWKAANSPWLTEQERWRERELSAKSKLDRLEDELIKQRTANSLEYQQRGLAAIAIHKSHESTIRDYEQELRQAEVVSQQIQIDEHLDKSLIRKANIKGITSGRILGLESFGIETAKDVSMLSGCKVPGIGPVLTQRLFDWRDRLAKSFKPKPGLQDSARNRIANRYAPALAPLATALQTAIHDLETLAKSHHSQEADRVREIAAVVQELAVAEAHVRAMKAK